MTLKATRDTESQECRNSFNLFLIDCFLRFVTLHIDKLLWMRINWRHGIDLCMPKKSSWAKLVNYLQHTIGGKTMLGENVKAFNHTSFSLREQLMVIFEEATRLTLLWHKVKPGMQPSLCWLYEFKNGLPSLDITL